MNFKPINPWSLDLNFMLGYFRNAHWLTELSGKDITMITNKCGGGKGGKGSKGGKGKGR